MSTDKDKVARKLSAILSADVKGYSLLMADDEANTIKRLEAYRDSMSDLIRSHSGRVVDAVGDNLLAEFSSIVDAVRCSVEIQKDLQQKNADLPTDKRLEFRIGVNIGDVIQEGDRIYGNGVNVAARIEALAESGGICISRNAYSHVRDKLELGYEYLGEHSVKNIKRPVRVYKVLMNPEDAGKLIGEESRRQVRKWVWPVVVVSAIIITSVVWQVYQKLTEPEFEPVKVEEMAYPLPDKPSIAVLAFDNLSGEPDQEYFSDGLTEEIITGLSKVPSLFVIARNSSFTYKGKPVKIQKVSEELGVRFVLEGSVRKVESRVRITAQLIDAVKGHHVWAERFDRDLKDMFALQDEITLAIIRAMQVVLTDGEQARLTGKDTENLDAYLKANKAHDQFHLMNREGSIKAKQLANEALKLDPNYAFPYATLANAHMLDVWFGYSESREESMRMAAEAVQKALTLDTSDYRVYHALTNLNIMQKQYEKAIASAEKGLKLNPSSAEAYLSMGNVLMITYRNEEAIPFFEKAIRLDPYPSSVAFRQLGSAYLGVGRYEEAVIEFKKVLQLKPNDMFAHLELASTYVRLDREEEARIEAKEVIRISPDFSLNEYAKSLPDPEEYPETADYIESLRRAGLPEHPPGKEQPEKPSIAVLPFDNLSDDPEQEYFSDGMTDDIITDLSKIKNLLVISRNSTFTYKGKDVKIPEVANELNVRYVLEGSVRRAGDQVRINAQLIDAKTDHHIWADRFDGKIENIFMLQDSITRRIVSALSITLASKEQSTISIIETNNIQAYDLVLKGINLIRQNTPQSYAEASNLLQKAVKLDPNYSRAYAELANLYWTGASSGAQFWKALNIGYSGGIQIGISYLDIAMRNPTPKAYQIATFVALSRRQFETAAKEAQKAIELNPNDSAGYAALSNVYMDTRPEEAISYAEIELKLDPQSLADSLNMQGRAHFFLKNYEKTVEFIERAGVHSPHILEGNAFLVAAYTYLGRHQDAIRTYKGLFLKGYGGNDPMPELVIHLYYIQKSENATLLINGLIKAGMPTQHDKYCRLSGDEKVSYEEVKKLVIGNTWTGYFWWPPRDQWWNNFTIDGINTLTYRGRTIKREYGFHDELLYVFRHVQTQRWKSVWTIYRNKHGVYDKKNEYIVLNESFIGKFSVQEEKAYAPKD